MRGGITRSRVARALTGRDPRFGRAFVVVIHSAILVSAIVITLQSMPDLPRAATALLSLAEAVILAIFTVEYAARLWSAERPLAYAASFWGIIDLVSILPALLFLYPDVQALRTLRLFRALRLLKLLRMRRALMRIEHAFRQSRDELILFSFLAAIILFLAAVGIYHFEHRAQPEAFGSIPQSLWWAVATLTTVGYGDVYPVTTGGRIFTGFTLLVGLGVVAIPAGIITSALLNAPDREERPGQDAED